MSEQERRIDRVDVRPRAGMVEGLVMVLFGEPISFLCLTPQQAEEWGERLLSLARQAREQVAGREAS